MAKRIITTENLEEDVKIESHLRPTLLKDYIGQEKAKETLKIYIEAAKARGESLDHVLFYGPPGLGKTTLAGIIANEMEVNVKITSGPAIEKPGEMAAILNNLQEGDVLFVDEIHRLNRQVEEVLYPAMEDYVIDIMIGKGAGARSIRLDLPHFTLVGATTRAGMLTAPLRDRFGVVQRLEFYTEEELRTIIMRSADVLGVEIDAKGALELAKRSRGTPRLANRLLKRVRDFAQVKYDGRITEEVANYALDLLDVDRYGLDHVDRNLLLAMIEKFQGGPVGLETLAASIGEDSGTIEDVCEPYLLKNGFIQRTPRGRIVTDKAYAHLTNAVIRFCSPAATPIISPIFSATGAPPTGQAEISASPFTIAAASPEHPAYPQPPQLLPGSASHTFVSRSSTSTANFCPATPRNTPMNRPTPPTIRAANIIPVILIVFPPAYKFSPENPKNAIAIKPAVTSTIGIPRKDSGTSLCSVFSRIPAMMTMAIVNPTAVANPFTTLAKIP